MGKFNDLVGQMFGKWLVIERAENDKRGQTMWTCHCKECGGGGIVNGYDLKTGHSTHCIKCARKGEDLTGRTFGSRTVLGRAERDKHGNLMWLCRCNGCKKISPVHGGQLRAGRSKQCKKCLGKDLSNGSGPVFEIRSQLGLSQEEFAVISGITRSGIHVAEKEGRFFKDGSNGPAAQLKFNRAVPSRMRQNRHNYKRRGNYNSRAEHKLCAWCGKLTEQFVSSANAGKRPCCPECTAKMRQVHEPNDPALRTNTNQLSPEVVSSQMPIAKVRNERRLYKTILAENEAAKKRDK